MSNPNFGRARRRLSGPISSPPKSTSKQEPSPRGVPPEKSSYLILTFGPAESSQFLELPITDAESLGNQLMPSTFQRIGIAWQRKESCTVSLAGGRKGRVSICWSEPESRMKIRLANGEADAQLWQQFVEDHTP